jgi:dTDP-4-amino-4,6-dideoxygalactose transaminase
MHDPIFVTQPALPPLKDLNKHLEGIWNRKVLTNGGPLHQELEEKLCDYLGVEYISLFANGTLALLVALKALRLSGKVITTPFSFVATSEALSWNGLEPIFADIDPNSYNLDPQSIINSITQDTTAILPVHCYGNPCDVDAIAQIADDYNLKVIYDAAHAFGVKCHCGSILNHGDLSILSFHATKVFNTFEGGAIVCPDSKTKKRIDRLKNFGFVNQDTVAVNGINAKMSELHAAIGLCQLPYIDDAIAQRKFVAKIYSDKFKGIQNITVPVTNDKIIRHNYSYYPIRISSKSSKISEGRDRVFEKLKENNIFSRKYFYPLINEFQYYKDNTHPNKCFNALNISNEVLCLPIYPGLSNAEAEHISNIVIETMS